MYYRWYTGCDNFKGVDEVNRFILLAGLLLLGGCAENEATNPVEPEAVVSATNDETEAEDTTESKEVELRKYSQEELDELNLVLVEASGRATDYLTNMRADIYMCGNICDGQPLSDIQLSMDTSRTGVEKSAASLEELVLQIRDVANSGSDNMDADEMNQVANQFEKTAADMRTFLAKEDWASWNEPNEMIQAMLDELEAVSWLYKPYSPAMSEDEAGNIEAETNISSATVEVIYALNELQSLYSVKLSGLREKPYGDDGSVASVSASYWDHTDQYLDQMRQAADLALQYEMDAPLKEEFEAVETTADELETAIADYNALVEPYNYATDYDALLVEWEKINDAMTRIESALSISTYEMQTYQDFVN